MKDSLEKQDKSKAVDIFKVMADAIQKEFVQLDVKNSSNQKFWGWVLRMLILHKFPISDPHQASFWAIFQSKTSQRQHHITQNCQNDENIPKEYTPATVAAAKKFKKFLGSLEQGILCNPFQLI